jgi:hypothetical protein
MMADDAPWYSTLDADHQTHVTSRGWEKLDPTAAAHEAVKAHVAATQKLGLAPEQVLRLPKDASDPSYQSVYDRVVGMGAPKTPEEYTFDGVRFKDGSSLAEDDAKFVRDLATKHKLPVHVARSLASDFAARADAMIENEGSSAAVTKAANDAALHQAWNTDYETKAFSASRAAEAVGFSPAVLAAMAGLSPPEYVKNMNALVFLGSQLTEATILRGGGTPQDTTVGLSPEQAEGRLAELKQDAAWREKFLANDTTVLAEFNKLNAIMHAPLRR